MGKKVENDNNLSDKKYNLNNNGNNETSPTSGNEQGLQSGKSSGGINGSFKDNSIKNSSVTININNTYNITSMNYGGAKLPQNFEEIMQDCNNTTDATQIDSQQMKMSPNEIDDIIKNNDKADAIIEKYRKDNKISDGKSEFSLSDEYNDKIKEALSNENTTNEYKYDLFLSARTKKGESNDDSLEYKLANDIYKFFSKNTDKKIFWWKENDDYVIINKKIAAGLTYSKNMLVLSFDNDLECLKTSTDDEKNKYFIDEIKTFCYKIKNNAKDGNKNKHNLKIFYNASNEKNIIKNTEFKNYIFNEIDCYGDDYGFKYGLIYNRYDDTYYNVCYENIQYYKLLENVLNKINKLYFNSDKKIAKNINKYIGPTIKNNNKELKKRNKELEKREKRRKRTKSVLKGIKSFFVAPFKFIWFLFKQIFRFIKFLFKSISDFFRWLTKKDILYYLVILFVLFIVFCIGLFAFIFWKDFEWYWRLYYRLYMMIDIDYIVHLILCSPFIMLTLFVIILMLLHVENKWISLIPIYVIVLICVGFLTASLEYSYNKDEYIKYENIDILGHNSYDNKHFVVEKIICKDENIIHLPLEYKVGKNNYYFDYSVTNEIKSKCDEISIIFDESINVTIIDTEMFKNKNVKSIEFPSNLDTSKSEFTLNSSINNVTIPLSSNVFDKMKYCSNLETVTINGGSIQENFFSNIPSSVLNINLFDDIGIDIEAFDSNLTMKKINISNSNYNKIKNLIDDEYLLINKITLSCYDVDENKNRIAQDYNVTFIDENGVETINKYKYMDEIKTNIEDIDGRLYNVEYFIGDEKIDSFYVTRDIKIKRVKIPVSGYKVNVLNVGDAIIEGSGMYKADEKIVLKAKNIPYGYIGRWEINDDIFYGKECTFNMPYSDVNVEFSYELYHIDDENCVYLGTYPQSLVADKELINNLNSLSNSTKYNKTWVNYQKSKPNSYINYNYMQYIDIDLDNDDVFDYRGVKIEAYRDIEGKYTTNLNYTYQYNNGYRISSISNPNIYWFKFEPIKWEILSIDNDVTFIFSNLILDNQYYYRESTAGSFEHNGGVGYASDYELSDIKIWFNSFGNDISLNESHNNMIKSVGSTNNFKLIEYQEMNNYIANKNFRIKYGTDYAKCMGLHVNDSGIGSYWIYSIPAKYMHSNGEYYGGSWNTCYGIVPAIKINLNANNMYTVTWKNDNGDVLELDENMKYGALPSYDGATPLKESTNQYTYLFDGWDKTLDKVTEDIIYTAKYKSTLRSYTVTWLNNDGSVLETDQNVNYGATPIYNGETPLYVSNPVTFPEFTYVFDGWSPDITSIIGEISYTAKYRRVSILDDSSKVVILC